MKIYFNSVPPLTNADTLKPSGIDFDILSEYLLWLKTNKQQNFTISYKFIQQNIQGVVKELNDLSIICGGQTSLSINSKEVDYSTPYLKNISFCITNGNAPDIKSKNKDEIIRALGAMKGLTVENAIIEKCMLDLKKQYLKDLVIEKTNSQIEILNQISKNVLTFGYVDAIEFWYFLKNNPTKFLKVQKSLDQNKENYVFIFKKNSPHKKWFDEFMNGFKTTPRYRILLEKHVGGFMAQNLSVK
ncbi:MAG: transporter substrate-binding domain-containing protein [Bacteroidia bacterium]|nr:transporter substrate-binding domain-containing protein [Bacteroidia bacterium]